MSALGAPLLPAAVTGRTWDLVVVGAGPAGASAALAARRADPTLSVLLVDRAGFPRDKACGDGVAPHALDLLAEVGVTGLADDRVPVRRLRLRLGDREVDREMRRPAWVLPRELFDARLVSAAVDAGAVLVRHRVRRVEAPAADRGRHGVARDGVVLDGVLRGRVAVGADGAHSQLRRSLGLPGGPTALAVRGYAPVSAGRAGAQVIAFGTSRQPSYAWSFDRGDGLANVGYGELLTGRRTPPTRFGLLAGLDALLPGAAAGGTAWRGHPLPLSTWRPLRPGRGAVLLAGDAAGLVNPLTGEGIYYAVATGLLAGRSAAAAVNAGTPHRAAGGYGRAVRGLLAGHLRHTALAARLSLHSPILDAGLAAAAADQAVFDDLVELGLARGRLSARLLRALSGQLPRNLRQTPRPGPTRGPDHEETPACEF